MPAKLTIAEQVAFLLQHLKAVKADDGQFQAVVDWVKDLPPASRSRELVVAIATAYNLTETDVDRKIGIHTSKIPFGDLVPRTGWLADYVEYTSVQESPLPFHFFVGLATIGGSLQRNVYLRWGNESIFPNMCVVLVAPSGKCRKTTAANLGITLLQSAGGRILRDKATPEALVEAFNGQNQAVGMLYAPELAVFLGKQKYQEGMVPLLTSLFDAPKEWTSLTIARQETKLTNVALSFIAASTMDWIQTGIPRDAHGGGFMSRLLFVVQEDTDRCFPIPAPPDQKLFQSLRERLIRNTQLRGEFHLSQEALDWYVDWYRKRGAIHDERQFSGYYERKPVHMFRIGMCLQMAEGDQLGLSLANLERSVKILDWLESNLPFTFDQMAQSPEGADHMRMLKQVRSKGGKIEHSVWLRMNSNQMNGRKFREILDTMIAARQIVYDAKKREYLLTPEGWR